MEADFKESRSRFSAWWFGSCSSCLSRRQQGKRDVCERPLSSSTGISDARQTGVSGRGLSPAEPSCPAVNIPGQFVMFAVEMLPVASSVNVDKNSARELLKVCLWKTDVLHRDGDVWLSVVSIFISNSWQEIEWVGGFPPPPLMLENSFK